MGWRGPPIEVPRGPRTIRIVFVGSSTVIDGHFVPYSYPEFVGNWLNLWAQAKKLDVRFEVLNSARESNISTDLAHIVRTEVLPLRPDLVVYYEGGNQFRPESIVDKVPTGSPQPPAGAATNAAPEWLHGAARWSALAGRIQAAIGLAASDADGNEWPKPDYKVVWPPGLDEQDPDLAYPNLPINLNVIERDLDQIRGDLSTIGSDFALSSFAWMVKDGLVLDPIRHRYILEHLSRPRAAGEFPEPFLRQVRARARNDLRRRRGPASIRSRPVPRWAAHKLRRHTYEGVAHAQCPHSADREASRRQVVAAPDASSRAAAAHHHAAQDHARLQAVLSFDPLGAVEYGRCRAPAPNRHDRQRPHTRDAADAGLPAVRLRLLPVLHLPRR
jgi:hypothetical protein